MEEKVVRVIQTPTPKKSALWFSTILAVDLGVSSILRKFKSGFEVVADDGKVVRFVR